MPKNTIKTGNCQYQTNGRACNKPPHFIHAKSGKVFCFNHYSKLSVAFGGWVNLQRTDAADELARLRGKEEQKELSDLQPSGEPSKKTSGVTGSKGLAAPMTAAIPRLMSKIIAANQDAPVGV